MTPIAQIVGSMVKNVASNFEKINVGNLGVATTLGNSMKQSSKKVYDGIIKTLTAPSVPMSTATFSMPTTERPAPAPYVQTPATKAFLTMQNIKNPSLPNFSKSLAATGKMFQENAAVSGAWINAVADYIDGNKEAFNKLPEQYAQIYAPQKQPFSMAYSVANMISNMAKNPVEKKTPQQQAEEYLFRDKKVLSSSVRAIGSVLTTPVAQFGAGQQALGEGNIVQGLSSMVFGALGAVNPTMMVFNAALGTETGKVTIGKAFEIWDEATQRTIYKILPKEVADAAKLGLELYLFAKIDKLAKAPFKDYVEVAQPGGKFVRVPVDKQWYADIKKQVIDSVNLFKRDPGKFLQEMPMGFSIKDVSKTEKLKQGEREGIEKAAPLPETKPETKPEEQALIEEAKKYKSVEEFVSKQKIVYHGTNNKFNEFDIEKIGSERDAGWYGKGLYFTNQKGVAKQHGGNAIEAIVDIKNPYIIEKVDVEPMRQYVEKIGAENFTKELQEKGYDGVIIKRPWYRAEGGQYDEIVAFSPTQIKTKSQLTDIWKKANEKLPIETLKQDKFAFLGADKKLTPEELASRGVAKLPLKLTEEELLQRDQQFATMKREETILKEEAQSVVADLEVMKEKMVGFSESNVNKIREVKKLINNNPEGDVETIRKTEPELVNGVLENVGEVKGLDNDEAFEFIKALPARGERAELRKLVGEMNRKAKEAGKSAYRYVAETFGQEMLKSFGKFTTRNIKLTPEYKDFSRYAQRRQDNDIRAPFGKRVFSMTAERALERFDLAINGRAYREILKPVYDARVKLNREISGISKKINEFKVLQGSTLSEEAFNVAEGKQTSTNKRVNDLVAYVRETYDDLLNRLNTERAKLGIEPIGKRKDYVTHLTELNTLAELFGSYQKVSTNQAIKMIKKRLVDEGVDPEVAFERAKRQIEGSTGLEMYIDAQQPTFKYAKERVKEMTERKDLISSFKAYLQPALQYIYQAENVAKNKAYKDVLPENAKRLIWRWNTEQVAGINPDRTLIKNHPATARAISILRNTIGANTILGNVSTMMMQLTSFPQVVALAGAKNFAVGFLKRLQEFVPGYHGLYEMSRTHATRSMRADIGFDDTVIDELVNLIGKIPANKIKNAAAHTRNAIKFGKNLFMAMMEGADQLMVGTTYHAFYNHAIKDKNMNPAEASEYADIMAGKTQANYFKEATPAFLNTGMGQILGQFGTYGLNQWQMIIKDFGKEFIDENGFNANTRRGAKTFIKHILTFLVVAYASDWLGEKTFGRQPFNVKGAVDAWLDYAGGDNTAWNALSETMGTVSSFVPFLSSVKYGSLPPVLELAKDIAMSLAGNDEEKQTAIDNFAYKWPWLLLMPFGGGQARKTLGAVEANMGVDVPFIKDPTKTDSGKRRFMIKDWYDEISSFVFGVGATQASRDYYDKPKKKDVSSDPFKALDAIDLGGSDDPFKALDVLDF